MLIPDFYLHIDTEDDASIPLPPLDDSHNGSLFHAVPEDDVVYFNDTEDQQLVGSELKDDSGISNNEEKPQPINMVEEFDAANGVTHSDHECKEDANSFLDSSVYSEENTSLNHHQQKPFMSMLDDQGSPYHLKSIPPVKRPHSARGAASRSPPMRLKLFASTPASLQLHSGGMTAEDPPDVVTPKLYIPEGTFLGYAMHKDGSLFSIVFQVCHFNVGMG